MCLLADGQLDEEARGRGGADDRTPRGCGPGEDFGLRRPGRTWPGARRICPTADRRGCRRPRGPRRGSPPSGGGRASAPPLEVTEPSASSSRIAGNRRHARAASIRVPAASSDRRRAPVQYANSDPYPSAAYTERRVSSSARWASSSTSAARSLPAMCWSRDKQIPIRKRGSGREDGSVHHHDPVYHGVFRGLARCAVDFQASRSQSPRADRHAWRRRALGPFVRASGRDRGTGSIVKAPRCVRSEVRFERAPRINFESACFRLFPTRSGTG